MTGKRRARWWRGAVALLAAAAVCWVCPCCTPLTEMLMTRRFDAEAWRAGSALDRGRMVRDLTASGRLVGLSRDEVVALLGDPDGPYRNEVNYTVDIGQRFGASPWTYTLQVVFDPNTGRVTNAYYHD